MCSVTQEQSDGSSLVCQLPPVPPMFMAWMSRGHAIILFLRLFNPLNSAVMKEFGFFRSRDLISIIHINLLRTRGSVVVWGTMLKARRSRVRFTMSLDVSVEHYGHACNRNENQESSWGVKDDGRVRLSSSPPSVSRVTRKCESFDVSQPYASPRPLLFFLFIYWSWKEDGLREVRLQWGPLVNVELNEEYYRLICDIF
jgi:hypothetical protein